MFFLVLERGLVLYTIWQTSNQAMQCIHSQTEPLPKMSRCKGHLPTQFPSDLSWSREDERKGKAAQPKQNATKLYMKFTVKVTHIHQYVTLNGQFRALVVVFLFPTIFSGKPDWIQWLEEDTLNIYRNITVLSNVTDSAIDIYQYFRGNQYVHLLLPSRWRYF